MMALNTILEVRSAWRKLALLTYISRSTITVAIEKLPRLLAVGLLLTGVAVDTA